MKGAGKQVPKLRSKGPVAGPMGVVVQHLGRLGDAIQARTPLGVKGGRMRRSSDGFSVGMEGGRGGGGGMLPPFYTVGSAANGQVEARVEPGYVYVNGVPYMPKVDGVELLERPVVTVPAVGERWVVLEARLALEWEEVPDQEYDILVGCSVVEGAPVEVRETGTIPGFTRLINAEWEDLEGEGVTVEVRSSYPGFLQWGLSEAPTVGWARVLLARVNDGRVTPVLMQDVTLRLDWGMGSAEIQDPNRPGVSLLFNGYQYGRSLLE